MIEFLLTLGVLAIVGFVVGVGVLLSKEYPQPAAFVNQRPVLGWTLVFVAGGMAVYGIVYIMSLFLLLILSLLIR